MTKRDVLLPVFHNRGWLSLALVSVLLEDPGLLRPGGLLGLEEAGLLVRRQLPGGLLLFHATRRGDRAGTIERN